MNEETADSKPGPLRSVTCLGQEYGLKPIVLCHAADKSNIIQSSGLGMEHIDLQPDARNRKHYAVLFEGAVRS